MCDGSCLGDLDWRRVVDVCDFNCWRLEPQVRNGVTTKKGCLLPSYKQHSDIEAPELTPMLALVLHPDEVRL